MYSVYIYKISLKSTLFVGQHMTKRRPGAEEEHAQVRAILDGLFCCGRSGDFMGFQPTLLTRFNQV